MAHVLGAIFVSGPKEAKSGNQKKNNYVSGDAILKQTVDPDPGYAVKEVFFTKKGNNVYAILPRYPKNKIVLKDIQTTGRTKITLLGSDKKVQWKQKGNDIEVIMPLLYVDELPCDYAWVLKLEKISE